MTNLSITDLALEAFQTQLQTIQDHLEGCIEGKDPIHLHDLRVANRRIRAGINDFKDLFSEESLTRFQQDFRWIHQITGEVRDLDVSLAHLLEYQKLISRDWRSYLVPMQNLLEEKREKAQQVLIDHLSSKKIEDILADWSRLLEGGLLTGNALSLEPARELGSRMIVKRYQEVRNKGLKLSKKTPAETFHAYRLTIKSLRYMMEFLRPVLDNDEIARLRTDLKNVQDVFGAFQDADIQKGKIVDLGLELQQTVVPAETLLAMGMLLGILGKIIKRSKKQCLRQIRWIAGDSAARTFQSCFQYPVE